MIRVLVFNIYQEKVYEGLWKAKVVEDEFEKKKVYMGLFKEIYSILCYL